MKNKPPGVFRKDTKADVVMMICTAGHVDHGKTSLVKLLTGCNTDRLKEEQERGLTIELGFAPCYLGGELCVGIVDVPGHEKFVKNMVAGVSGIDSTMLVIAADDGIMPQTIEHIEIMELLGVKNGIIALTKTDLVSPERIAELKIEVKEYLADTFLSGAEIYPVSSETFQGYPEFYDALVSHIKTIAAKRKKGIFRLPVEKIFSGEGHGRIITGIPISGKIKVGDYVELIPGNHKGKVRGIQCFLRDAEEGSSGQCLAINIPDFNKLNIERGNIIATPGFVKSAKIFHLNIKSINSLPKNIPNAEEIKFHTGTSETPGKLYLLEDKELGKSQTAFASVMLSDEIAAVPGDRFIIRRASPAITIAGGEIISIDYSEKRPQRKIILEKLINYASFMKNVPANSAEYLMAKIKYFMKHEIPSAGSIQQIAEFVFENPEDISESVNQLCLDNELIKFSDGLYIHRENFESVYIKIKNKITNLAEQKKILSVSLSELRDEFKIPNPLWDMIDKKLESEKIAKKSETKYIFSAASGKFETAQDKIIRQVLEIYKRTGFTSPRPDEAALELKMPEDKIGKILEHLCNQKLLVRLSKNVLLTLDNLRTAQNIVIDIIKKKGFLDSADFKVHINSSRKYALAILDFLDLRGITIRIENNRKLAKDYEKKLF